MGFRYTPERSFANEARVIALIVDASGE